MRETLQAADPGPNRWSASRRAWSSTADGAVILGTGTDRHGPWGTELWTPLSLWSHVELHVEIIEGTLHSQDVLGLFLLRPPSFEVDVEIARWGVERGPDVFHSSLGEAPQHQRLMAAVLASEHEIEVGRSGIVLRSSTSVGTLRSGFDLGALLEGPPPRLHLNLWRRDREARGTTRVLVRPRFRS